jgi:hypothetical protein
MNWTTPVVLLISLILLVQAALSLYLMLYSWEYPERLYSSSAPASYLSPRLSFSVLLPARHEEAVIQATIILLLWPVNIMEALWLKENLLVTMWTFIPLYALLLQFLATAVGAFLFTKEYGLRFSLFRLVLMTIIFLPFQWLLGISAVRGVYREMRGQNNWEKTTHLGAQRQYESLPQARWEKTSSFSR